MPDYLTLCKIGGYLRDGRFHNIQQRYAAEQLIKILPPQKYVLLTPRNYSSLRKKLFQALKDKSEWDSDLLKYKIMEFLMLPFIFNNMDDSDKKYTEKIKTLILPCYRTDCNSRNECTAFQERTLHKNSELYRIACPVLNYYTDYKNTELYRQVCSLLAREKRTTSRTYEFSPYFLSNIEYFVDEVALIYGTVIDTERKYVRNNRNGDFHEKKRDYQEFARQLACKATPEDLGECMRPLCDKLEKYVDDYYKTAAWVTAAVLFVPDEHDQFTRIFLQEVNGIFQALEDTSKEKELRYIREVLLFTEEIEKEYANWSSNGSLVQQDLRVVMKRIHSGASISEAFAADPGRVEDLKESAGKLLEMYKRAAEDCIKEIVKRSKHERTQNMLYLIMQLKDHRCLKSFVGESTEHFDKNISSVSFGEYPIVREIAGEWYKVNDVFYAVMKDVGIEKVNEDNYDYPSFCHFVIDCCKSVFEDSEASYEQVCDVIYMMTKIQQSSLIISLYPQIAKGIQKYITRNNNLVNEKTAYLEEQMSYLEKIFNDVKTKLYGKMKKLI